MSHVETGKKLYLDYVTILRERVIESGVSFNEISRRSGVDVSQVSRIVNGKSVPTFPVLYALYKAIDTEINLGGIFA